LASSSVTDLKEQILARDIRGLARAATLIEARGVAGRELISALFRFTGKAMFVGITGPPGAGKSTLVSGLVKLLRADGQTVGVLAVDPSSPYSRGAILGDRIRMQDHHDDPNVFIRSMATRGHMGGLAVSTLEMALLLDAAGFDVVLIETVGVGQDEVEIARVADVTVVVLVPGVGDDVQALKAGMMEVADVFAINKADLPGADRLEQDIRAMQSLAVFSEKSRTVPICQVTASEGRGLNDLLKLIQSADVERGSHARRTEAWLFRLREMLRDYFLELVPEIELRRHAALVAKGSEDPYTALRALVSTRHA